MTVKSKTHKGTWMGRPGESTEWPVSGGRLGLRTTFHQWADERTGTLRLIEGDGRTDGFREYVAIEGVLIDEAMEAHGRWVEEAQ